ncbi:MAG: hydroxyisourate hydrolase [Streptosporangiaceae bacterium]
MGPGTYRLVFDTGRIRIDLDGGEKRDAALFPEVTVTFSMRDPAQDYHVPLLLSPFGYATYRGT